MAFTISADKKIAMGGFTPGMAKVTGTGTATSVTSCQINGADYGIRKITDWNLQLVSGTGVTAVVKSYDATTDGDILTATCTSGDVFHFSFEGEDNGDL